MASLNTYTRRSLLAGLVVFAGVAVLPGHAKADEQLTRVGLIDLNVRPEFLNVPGVKIRHLSFWASGYTKATKQSAAHKQDHGEVMARALISAYQTLSPRKSLELFIASPFVESDGRKLLDVEQLGFAFDWFASQGVKIVAMTFVGRNTPALSAALDHAARRGLVVLSSAGNGPTQNPVPAYPAAYPTVIAIGTTALNADRNAEDAKLHQIAMSDSDVPSARRNYVDYGVKAPVLTSAQVMRDPEVTSLLGSSRATVVAAGVLAAAAETQSVGSMQEALAILDSLTVQCEADIAARGVLDLTVLQTSVRVLQPFKAERTRDAA
ncbi:MAG: hypothetical protein JNM81_00480 [Rhodospirillaceae bacterium]|nr:hypothetical protein [Rhodospirillaceae bacterium]